MLERASTGIDKLLAQSIRLAPPAQAPLLAWPVVCGSAVAERTRALGFQDGILSVEVSDAGWRSELKSLAPQYLVAINRFTKQPVCRIEFVVAPARAAGEI
ncbi:MAG TPA: DUF721 domain-containing protein [Candidatus Sulfotelmatobacter sp.]|nr:DUF721 domain-containing protein [Candidatus Sulfotelmatobacter sp.]